MIAALAAWHEQHETAARALADVTVLPAHVALEAYSVLTRLPSGLAVPAPAAAVALRRRFGSAPLRLDERGREHLLATLSEAGVHGGASYDGLVALEAASHDRTLLTFDGRAAVTYGRLGIRFELLAA